jgi:hypothetical protein
VAPLLDEGLLDGRQIGDLRARNGYTNLIVDARRLCQALRQRWADIGRRTALRIADLEQVETAASALAACLAARSPDAEEVVSAADLRARAFTRFVDVYDQARRAITYLRWVEGDVDEIVPSLFAKARRR